MKYVTVFEVKLISFFDTFEMIEIFSNKIELLEYSSKYEICSKPLISILFSVNLYITCHQLKDNKYIMIF